MGQENKSEGGLWVCWGGEERGGGGLLFYGWVVSDEGEDGWFLVRNNEKI